MEKKEVLLVLTDYWADWEACHAIVGINSSEEYTVKTIAIDKQPKVSAGGLRTEIDYCIDDYQNFNNLAMVIMTGSFSWQEKFNDKIADFVKNVALSNVPIAAICGATIFLGKHGFLNNIKHTGDTWDYFYENLKDEAEYTGKENFEFAQVVNDGNFITANETASVEFAAEILRTLNVFPSESIDGWHEHMKNGMVR